MTLYTVKSGDSLSKIAGTLLGDQMRYTEIAALNNIQDVNRIFPGQVLQIPAVGDALKSNEIVSTPVAKGSTYNDPYDTSGINDTSTTAAPAPKGSNTWLYVGATVGLAIAAALAVKHFRKSKKNG